jgi:hypothetical protein
MNKLHFTGNDWCASADELSPELLEALLDCGASGDASDAVAYVRSNFEVTGDEATCAKMLRGYGAWDDDELADHDKNLNRLVWLAGCDLREQGEAYFCTY